MTKQELIDLLDSWENLELIINEVASHPEQLKLLFEIALHSSYSRRWRAAWVADKINDVSPNLIEPFLEEIISALPAESNPGIKRHLLKLISMNEIPEKYRSVILNCSLKYFTSDSEPVAVRVHAMQVLYNISEKESELKPELLAVIQHEIEVHPSPGLRSRGNKLARQLQQQIRKSGIHFI